MPRITPSHASTNELIDEAARWCMRLHADDCSDAERATFEQWLASDPAHRREYRAMLDIWQNSGHGTRPATPAAAERRIRRPVLISGMALVLSLATALGWYQGWVPHDIQRYHAGDQIREVTLPDGSHVHLNLGTTLWFGNFRDSRSVTLSEGEALFEVHRDKSHPFHVHAGNGSVTVTGTRFNVWKYEDQVVVTLTEGSVQVQHDRRQPQETTPLKPGQQARYSANGLPPRITPAEANNLTWLHGKLALDSLPLDEALPLINRYLDKPLLLADQSTAKIRISGYYDIRNIEQLVEALPKILPVSLSRNADGETIISSRR